MCNVLSVPNNTTESATMQGSTPSPDTPSSRMDQVANPSIDGLDQEPTLLTDSNGAQNLVQQGQASTKVFDESMTKTLNKALNPNESSDSQKIQSLHIGDEQHNQNLEKAHKPTSNQPAENKSQISSESTKTEGTTITKEISSGQHPHLDEEINNAVQAYFNPEQKEVKTEDAGNLIDRLKTSKITDQDGNIDFEAVIELYNKNLETNPELNPKAFKKASIKGKVSIKDGKFDFKISGKCSNEAVECMTALKKVLENTTNTLSLTIPININPASVGPLSAEDQAALANGGQIQYRSLQNGQVMKLTLDPGSNGEGDGLTIGVYNSQEDHSLEQLSSSPKIPLKVVFEGGEFNRQKVGPSLPNWRAEKLFENSIIHSEMNLIGTKTRSTNENDDGRIKSQNMLWNAVNEYLKVSAERTDGHFDISNKPPEDKTKNTHTINETENAVNNDGILMSENNHSPADTGNTNDANTDTQGAIRNENPQGDISEAAIPQEQTRLTDIHSSDGDLGSKDDPLLVTIKEIDNGIKELEEISDQIPPELNSEVKKIISNGKALKQNFEDMAKSPKKTDKKKLIEDLNALNTALQPLTSLLENEDNALQEELVEDPIRGTAQEETIRAQSKEEAKPSKRVKEIQKAARKLKDRLKELTESLSNEPSSKLGKNTRANIEAKTKLQQAAKKDTAVSPNNNEEKLGTEKPKNTKWDNVEKHLNGVDIPKLEGLSVIAKQKRGYEILAALANRGISTTDINSTNIVNDLIEFQKLQGTDQYKTYKNLLDAFAEHKKNNKEKAAFNENNGGSPEVKK